MSEPEDFRDQAKEILEIVERMHISLPELANRIAVTSETMRKIANGYQKAGPVVMQAIRNVEYMHTLLREGVRVPPYRTDRLEPTAQACLDYVREFLARCENDPNRLGWFLVELKERFPLDKWGDSPTGEPPKTVVEHQKHKAPVKAASSDPVSKLAREGALLAGRAVGIEPRLPEPKPGAGEHTGQSGEPK
ncbi:MAG: hypothetical protein JWM16_567 [Verrucomicrobiales bacterium]|nr:hypothetical protein [Verrucomicrobiales bacterium]